MGRGWARRATLAGLLVMALLAGLDHAQWSARSSWPLSFGDSGLHTLQSVQAAMREQERPSPWHRRELQQTGYYPPFAYWLSLPVQASLGISTRAWPISQALYTAALCLGTGLLGLRAWGAWAGLTAAALVLTAPGIWAQRAEGMLDLPLAGALALFLGLLPSARRPSALQAALAGLALGAALLTKQTMLFFAPPAFLWLGLRAASALRAPRWAQAGLLLGLGALGLWLLAAFAWGQARGWLLPMERGGMALVLAAALAGALRRDLRPLRDLLLVLVVALLVADRWYAHSASTLARVLAQVARDHQLPEGWQGLWWRLSYLPWLRSSFLFAPLAWAWTAGLLLLPLGLRRGGPWLLLLCFGAGWLGLSNFPDPHDRHFLPLLAPIAAMAAAPVGWLSRRWSPLGAAGASLALVHAALFCWSWREPGWGKAGQRMESRDGRLEGGFPTASIEELGQRWAWVSGRWVWLAPLPPSGRWPVGRAVEVALEGAPATGAGTLISTADDWLGADLLRAEATARGAILTQTRRVGRGGGGAAQAERPCWIWAEDPSGREQLPGPGEEAAGLEELARLSATLPQQGQPRVIVVACRPRAEPSSG